VTRSKSESREERSSEVEGSWKRHKINLDDLAAEYDVFLTLPFCRCLSLSDERKRRRRRRNLSLNCET
jgi:hypothetical protein